MQDNMKQNNICIIGILEGEEEDQRIENLFEKVMMANVPNLMRKKSHPNPGNKDSTKQEEPKAPLQDTIKLKWQNSKTKKES